MPNGTILRAPMVSYAWVFAPGAICSSAGDLITWLQALHGGKVLSARSYTEMTTPAALEDGTRLQYGMGIKIGENYKGLRYVGHGGTAPGFRSDATWYPDGRLAVVVLVNTSPANLVPAGVGFSLAEEILPPPRPSVTHYTGDATNLVGAYQWVAGGNQGPTTLEITMTEAGLAVSPNGGRPLTLAWGGGLTFYIGDNTVLTFHRTSGASGSVDGLHIDDAGNHRIFKKR